MTSEAAKLELQLLLLRAVVDSKDQEIERLREKSEWLARMNRGLRAQIETLEIGR